MAVDDTTAGDAQSAVPGRSRLVRAALWARRELPALFWFFVICSVAGLVLEEAYHLVVFHEVQSRAGLLFGPFSPIYGVGGVCAFCLARPLRRAPAPVALLALAAVGGVVEFLVSWSLEAAFGFEAWDYTGTWLSVDGRTNGCFMCLWGLLGLVCVRLLVPAFERWGRPLLRRLPAPLTGCCAVLMALDVALTLVSFNCWYLRASGCEPQTLAQVACEMAFDDVFMERRFESIALDPATARRATARLAPAARGWRAG